MRKLIPIAIIAGIVIAAWFYLRPQKGLPGIQENLKSMMQENRQDFSQYSKSFRFSATIPEGFKVEHIKNINALNIYNPADPAPSTLSKSQIFIRYFEADDFETLQTVDVYSQESRTINGHDAVIYDIAKKVTALGFPYQPPWRNDRHNTVDIRFARTNPSLFYVFARNPEYSEAEFDKFIASLKFHNDISSLVMPIADAPARATKKYFSTFVTPENSPVQPEKFTGYHTGADYEIFPGEENIDVPVSTFCGGPLKVKRTADGYGGIAVQDCVLGDQPVTVIYGHLKLSSITSPVTRYLQPGTPLGILGKGNSAETSGERKHLHFGIHLGTELNIAGYVSNQNLLSNWLDPAFYIK